MCDYYCPYCIIVVIIMTVPCEQALRGFNWETPGLEGLGTAGSQALFVWLYRLY